MTDCTRRTLQRFDLAGERQELINGRESNNSITFGLPADVAVNSSGYLFVVDELEHVVWVISPDGEFVTTFGGNGTDPGELRRPLGVAIAPDDSIYVVDHGNHRVQHFSSDFQVLDVHGVERNGTPVASSEPSGFSGPYYADVAADGTLVVVDRGNHRIKAIDSNGSVRWMLGAETAEPGTERGEFNYPHEVSVGPENRLFVADTLNDHIQILNLAGEVIGVIDGQRLNPKPKVATINPNGILFTASVSENRSLQRWQIRASSG